MCCQSVVNAVLAYDVFAHDVHMLHVYDMNVLVKVGAAAHAMPMCVLAILACALVVLVVLASNAVEKNACALL